MLPRILSAALLIGLAACSKPSDSTPTTAPAGSAASAPTSAPAAATSTPPTKSAAPSSPAPFSISKVKGEVKNGLGSKGGKYARFDFKAACKVGDETLVDTKAALAMGADALEAGQTAKGDVSFWPLEPLDK